MNFSDFAERAYARYEDIPPVDRWGVYAKGAVNLLRSSREIQSMRSKNREAIAEQGAAFFDGVEVRVFEEMSEQIMDGMNWILNVEGHISQVNTEDRWLYIMNHPTLIASWTPLHYASQHLAKHTAIVAKSELLDNPVSALMLGNPLRDVGRAIFINRDVREEALSELAAQAERVLRPSTGLVIFPDGHRPYPSKLLKDRKTWAKKRPDLKVNTWMTETCFPRSGGLWQLLQSTQDMPNLRLANFTVAEPLEKGGGFRIALEELSRADLVGAEPSEAHLQTWLVEEWKRKNEQIRRWRGLFSLECSSIPVD